MPTEEYALVLDYLEKGIRGHTPIAQVMGCDFFTLLEVVPKERLEILEKVYIGKGERAKIQVVKRRISYKELTSAAQSELENAVEKVVSDNEKKFVDFYNTSVPITLRMHQLQLLPGIGSKHLMNILAEREKKPFESFEEVDKRVPLMPDPKKLIIRRIIDEIKGENIKHYLFARPAKSSPFRR
jgi:putative nucleotide binding protein